MIIYKAISPSGKSYVGQTIRTIEHRISQHRRGTCPLFSRAVQKYGDRMEWEVIDTASNLCELNRKEAYWIKKLNTMAPAGYNLKPGGLSFGHTAATRAKLSIAAKKQWEDPHHRIAMSRRMSCRHISDATKQKLSESHRGNEGHWKGKKFSKEHRRRLSIAHMGNKSRLGTGQYGPKA